MDTTFWEQQTSLNDQFRLNLKGVNGRHVVTLPFSIRFHFWLGLCQLNVGGGGLLAPSMNMKFDYVRTCRLYCNSLSCTCLSYFGVGDVTAREMLSSHSWQGRREDCSTGSAAGHHERRESRHDSSRRSRQLNQRKYQTAAVGFRGDMGGSQSVQIPGGGSEGYHVLRVRAAVMVACPANINAPLGN